MPAAEFLRPSFGTKLPGGDINVTFVKHYMQKLHLLNRVWLTWWVYRQHKSPLGDELAFHRRGLCVSGSAQVTIW